MNLKVLIVDDEQDSRDTLQNYLVKYCDGVEVVGQCENIAEAKRVIEEQEIDLLFLDVEMPFGSGFDLLKSLPKIDFEVVFVTAYSQYALQALNLSASHYLLKPLDIDEMVEAFNKVKARKKEKEWLSTSQVLVSNLLEGKKQHQKIVLPVLEGFEVKKVSSILYCQAEDNFTRFVFTDQKEMLICKTLKHYDGLLQEFGFLRIHRSYLINSEYIAKYTKGKGGFVTMENGKELEVSASKKAAFLEKFGV